MKQKILYIITKDDIGGAQKYANDLIENLDKKLFEAKIIYGGKDIKWLSNKILPWFLFLNDWLAIKELIQLFKKENPHIVHLNSSKASVLGAIAAKIYNSVQRLAYSVKEKLKTSSSLNANCLPLTAKVIFTAHGWVFNPTNALPFLIRWFYIFLHKIAALFQDKIICVSEYDYKLALQYKIAPAFKLVSIHNGIDPNIKFLNRETAKREILKKLYPKPYTLNPNLPWIGSIGRLVKEKNYETFIKAATFIPDAVFFIIGSGPEQEKLKMKSEKLQVNERFFIIDPTGNDAQYLKAFDVFVMSSIKEGLPYILLEAMAAELPIVVTEAGGIPEIIKNHENGLMVSQKNPEMLAKAIQGLVKNKNIANELKTTAKKIVQEKFNLKQMITKTQLIYRENPVIV